MKVFTRKEKVSYLDGGEFEKVEKADVRLVVKDQVGSVEGNVFDPARIIAGESTTLNAAYRLLFANVVEGNHPVGEAQNDSLLPVRPDASAALQVKVFDHV